MARSINIAKLLSVYAVLMDDDHVRINFVKYVAETHPRILLKFSGRDELSEAAKADEAYERMEQELRAERYKRDQTEKELYEVKMKCSDMRNELNALKNPVSNDASNMTKIIFDRVAVEQDQTFGADLNNYVKVSFILHDQNKKISTIKWCREQTGYGLVEAKGWVEGCSGNDYKCSFGTVLKLRESFRTFAKLHGYTGVIYIKGE
jgi:ribosomal protein L7/L12